LINIDIDFKCLKSIAPLIEGRKMLFFWEPTEHSEPYDYPIKQRLCVGFHGSSPKQQLWLDYMDDIMSHFKLNVLAHLNTGPVAFSSFFQSKGYDKSNPEWFGDVCSIMANTSRNVMCSACRVKYPGHPEDFFRFEKARIGIKPFHEMYAYNNWNEGTSGWGVMNVDNGGYQSWEPQPKVGVVKRDDDIYFANWTSNDTTPKEVPKSPYPPGLQIHEYTPPTKPEVDKSTLPKDVATGGLNLGGIIAIVVVGKQP
jgi:hypothetical protein